MINEVSETLMPMIELLQNVDPLGFPALHFAHNGSSLHSRVRLGKALPPHRQSVQEAESDVGLQAWDEEGWQTGE